MSQKEFNGKTYYPYIGSLLLNIRKVSYSSYKLSNDQKENLIISGEGVVYCDGLEVIENGYKNNIIFVRISSWNEEKSASLNSQIVQESLNKKTSFAGLYYLEQTSLKFDNLQYEDDYTEEINSISKIHLDLYIDDQDIKSIIQNYNNNNISGFNVTIEFNDLLNDSPFNYPGEIKYIPPLENGNFFYSIGVFKGFSFSFSPKYFDYVESKGLSINTVINEKSKNFYIEHHKNDLKNFDKIISILKTNSHLITKMIDHLRKIEQLLIIIAITIIWFLVYTIL